MLNYFTVHGTSDDNVYALLLLYNNIRTKIGS